MSSTLAAARAVAWRQANPDKVRETNRRNRERMRQTDPEFFLLKGARERAKKQGLPFAINREHIVIPDVCPILGIPITINVLGNAGGSRDQSPSLDKVIPELGYVPGNVRVISNKANRLKADNTIETLEAILKYMKG